MERANKKLLIFIGVCLGIGMLAVVVATFDFYPIAFVNFRPIMAYRFNGAFDVAQKYYGKVMNPADSKNQVLLKQAVLEGLIDEVAVDTQLKKKLTSLKIDNKVNAQISEIMSDASTTKIFSDDGISKSDAEKYLLTDTIKNQLLSGQLALEGKQFLTWLVEARKSLKVVVLLPHAHWTDNGVEFDEK